MVEHQPSKLDTWVRFPSPALMHGVHDLRSKVGEAGRVGDFTLLDIRASGSAVEHLLAKEGVAGSIPVSRSEKKDDTKVSSFFCYSIIKVQPPGVTSMAPVFVSPFNSGSSSFSPKTSSLPLSSIVRLRILPLQVSA